MKYVKKYYPVHYLSISREAPVPATGGLSLTCHCPEVTEDKCPLPHCHLCEGHLGQVTLPCSQGAQGGKSGKSGALRRWQLLLAEGTPGEHL